MRDAGFRLVSLSDSPEATPEDKARAIKLNDAWDRHRRGLPEAGVTLQRYPSGSIGDGYLRAIALRKSEREAKGIVWTREQHSARRLATRMELDRAAVRRLRPQDRHARAAARAAHSIVAANSLRERGAPGHQGLARAVEEDGARSVLRHRSEIPFLRSPTRAPQPRQAIWTEGEAVRLVKQAWRERLLWARCMPRGGLGQSARSGRRAIDLRQSDAARPRGRMVRSRARQDRPPALATLSRRADAPLTGLPRDAGRRARGIGADLPQPIRPPYSKDTLGRRFPGRARRRVRRGREAPDRRLPPLRHASRRSPAMRRPRRFRPRWPTACRARTVCTRPTAGQLCFGARCRRSAQASDGASCEGTKTGQKCHQRRSESVTAALQQNS